VFFIVSLLFFRLAPLLQLLYRHHALRGVHLGDQLLHPAPLVQPQGKEGAGIVRLRLRRAGNL
ncbi:DUF1540 domain-containing protein, partial [Dysosmobacter welbionis]